MAMDAVTICAVNYLPFATTLGNSFLDNNPNGSFSILVIDGEKVPFNKHPKFNYLSPSELALDKNVFENMTLYYNVTELSTALKPSALKTLFKNGSEKVIYLDPDIQVFDLLSEVDQALDRSPIVLTPHNLEPIPRDGLRPTEADILESGTFNLGFIGVRVSEISLKFLDWWEERLRFDSIASPAEMLFTDQRWIDLVPSYFPIEVLRHPGYNTAYWNLHEREFSLNAEKFFVNGEALKFFHFSGYMPDAPWILSKYVSNNPRITISSNSIVDNLCTSYGKQAIANGWQSNLKVAYGFSSFGNRKNIPSSLRRLFREDCIKAFEKGQTFLPPSDWIKWATQRSAESGNLSRILFSIWRSRPDLIQRFPDATGKDSQALVDWAKKYGVSQNVIDEDLIEIGEYLEQSFPKTKSKQKGLNVVGYLKGELGVGQSSRLVLKSAISTNYPVTALNYGRLESRQDEKYDLTQSDEIFPFTVAVINADQFKIWTNDFGVSNIRDSKIVGLWAWETEDFPEGMQEAFTLVDEIWAVSEFVKNALRKHSKKPIFVFPTPISSPKLIEKLDRDPLGIPEDIPFNLFIFDYMSVFNRKNPMGLVEAHKKAFPNSDGPLLVIKSANGNKDPENRELLRHSVKNRSDITLIEDYLTRNQISALINECDAYISLHRSEGYGLTIAEAMSLGKPVIATAYSGNLDFMNEENSFLVPFRFTEVGNFSYPYNPDTSWAEPNLDIASELMKLIHFDKKIAQRKGLAAKNYIESNFTFDLAAEFIKSRVDYHFSLSGKINFKFLRMTQKLKFKVKTLTRGIKRTLKELIA